MCYITSRLLITLGQSQSGLRHKSTPDHSGPITEWVRSQIHSCSVLATPDHTRRAQPHEQRDAVKGATPWLAFTNLLILGTGGTCRHRRRQRGLGGGLNPPPKFWVKKQRKDGRNRLTTRATPLRLTPTEAPPPSKCLRP